MFVSKKKLKSPKSRLVFAWPDMLFSVRRFDFMPPIVSIWIEDICSNRGDFSLLCKNLEYWSGVILQFALKYSEIAASRSK